MEHGSENARCVSDSFDVGSVTEQIPKEFFAIEEGFCASAAAVVVVVMV